ncbi:hypothetical protein [Halopseudomonas sp.]|uniref:hypothetical protein n=1 Tax=Halopseudomonas sp. TaxID=2901191 RepID=UPI00300257A9
MPQPDDFYHPGAYRPDAIPEQPPAIKQPRFKRFGSLRLPWGSTQDMMPPSVLKNVTPDTLRYQEELEQTGTTRPFAHIDLHVRFDNERIRHARLPASSQLWLYMNGIGKWGLVVILPLLLPVCLYMATFLEGNYFLSIFDVFFSVFPILILPLFVSWFIGWIVVNHFPKLWIKPSKGPLWEFNRRTGLVTVFDYDNDGEYKKDGTVGEKVAPFYEFDAYVTVSPDRQGFPNNVLSVVHRYQDSWINMANFVAPSGSASEPCGLWDYLQNYMDITQPLPDTPQMEPYRHLDPTTAEYDRQTGREPRYWRDMDDDTFNAKVREMTERIPHINTLQRTNLMTRYVNYHAL